MSTRQTYVVPRCNATERAAFRARRDRGANGAQHGEPALGTVDQRLSIALARLGHPQRIVLTREERQILAQCRGDGTWTQDDLPWGWGQP